MKRKFSQIGNSWGLIFPKPLLELLNIVPENDEAEIKVIDDEIRIKKAKKKDI